MSEKKRKRDNEAYQSSKKVALSSLTDAEMVKISIFEDVDQWAPILASTPGLSLPSPTSFKPYRKSRPQTSRSAPPPELLLHASANPKLDYIAREEEAAEASTLLKHYVGVYDPEKNDLQLVPARKLTVRGTLRPTATDNAVQEVHGSQNTLSARSTLNLTFGTKKSKAAIHALTQNAIPSSSPSKHLPSSQTSKPELDPLASAVVETMASTTASMPTREDLQADINSSKPIPKPNLEAETVEEVWTLESLVGTQTLRMVHVGEWIEKVKGGEEILCKSRFVANRVEGMAKEGEVKRLRGLRYLLLLVEWYHCLKKGGGRDKHILRVPRREELQKSLAGWGNELVEGVNRKFAERGQLNKWHTHNLLTHILALALILDNCTTDTHDIREDLRLDNKEISTLHAELSTPLSAPTDTELKRLKMSRTEAAQSGHRFARLKLPLAWPRMRVGKRGR